MAKTKKGVQYSVVRGEGVKYKKKTPTNGITKATVYNTTYDVTLLSAQTCLLAFWIPLHMR